MKLQSNQSSNNRVDSAEAEAELLTEERLSQFSDELQLESDLFLEEAQQGIENKEANTENIAPSQALSVRYRGSESVQAYTNPQTETLLNQSIMSIESSDTIPMDLSDDNSPALPDYSLIENSDLQLLPDVESAASAPSLQTPESSYAARSTSSTPYGTSGGGGGAIEHQSVTQRATGESNENTPVVLDADVPFYVYGWQSISAEDSQNMIFTIADEQGTNPLPANFNILIEGFEQLNPDTGVLEKPILDGLGLYSGIQMLYTSTYTRSPSITIKNLSGMVNFEKISSGDAVGGAITLINGNSEIIFNNDVDSPITFENNHVYTTGTTSGSSAAGGAIFLSGGPSVGDLRANFYNNSASIIDPDLRTSSRYARGGAIAIGFIDDYPTGYQPKAAFSYIDSITGDFVDNKASFGGAIYTGAYSSIGNITGDFVRNIAEGYVQSGHSSGADGGAFRTYAGTIGSITGDFTDNTAHAYTGNALGGAISLWLTNIKGTITGTFEGNMAFSKNASAWGGALVLRDQGNSTPLQLTDVSFYNNVAGTGTTNTNNVRGGAIYITNSSDVIITADNENVVIRDNYTVTNSSVTKSTSGENDEQWTYDITENTGVERDYTAIYLDGSNLKLETTAGSDKTITIDDAIKSSLSTVESVITVSDASHTNTENEYGVFLNGELGMDKLVVETGGVQLGSATHSDGSTTTGSFVNQADLTIMETGRIKTNADYLKNVGTVDLQGVNRDTAALINFTGGKLVSDINPDGVRHGHIAITGATIFGVDPDQPTDRTIANADTISVLNTLELMEATTVNANTLFFYGYDEADVNTTNHIAASPDTVFSFSEIELNFATANPGDIFEIIVSDGTGQLTIDYDFSKTVVFTVAGQTLEQGEDKDFIVRKRADGGIEVEILIHVPPPPPVPEPSTATLSLIALVAFLRRRRRAA